MHTHRRLMAYGLALALSIGCIGWLFSPAFLMGQAELFQQGDTSQHVSGWLFFSKDAWHWPLLKTVLLNAPGGVSIVFTDSIPIAALLFKPFVQWLPHNFHYFGLWYSLVFMTQALAAVFVMRMMGLTGALPAVLAAGFAMLWHPLLQRIGQTSLTTHSLLLLALGLYFGARSGRIRPIAAMLGAGASVLLAAWIHAYFIAMLLPFLLLLAVVLVQDRRLPGPHAASLVVGTLLLLGGVFWGSGYFSGGSNFRDLGFGTYSLNLLSPFCSGMLCAGVDATGGQALEGGVYLGAGTIALMIVALVCCGRQVIRGLRSHALLAVLLLLFTLYALSSSIYLGNHLLVHAELPQEASRITSMFRASGRFFWPVSYTLLFATLALLLRQKAPVLGFMAVAALCLQLWEVSPKLQQIRSVSHDPVRPSAIHQDALLRGMDRVILYPFFGCANNDSSAYLPYMRGAAEHGLPINTGYVSRAQYACDALPQELQRQTDDTTLHVLVDALNGTKTIPPVFVERIASRQCAVLSGDLVCRSGFDSQEWRDVAKNAAVPGSQEEALSILDMQRRLPECRNPALPAEHDATEVIRLGGNGTSPGCKFLGNGWHPVEGWGVWSFRHQAQLVLPIRTTPATLELQMSAFTGGQGSREVRFLRGTEVLGEARVSDQMGWHTITIPAEGSPAERPLVLTIEIDRLTSPAEVGMNGDSRDLGIGLQALRWSLAAHR